MFCPKCGTQNSGTGKFCRSCGTNLGNVTDALSGKVEPRNAVDRKGRPVSYEGAVVKIFTGLAFLVISIALALSATGRGWWFWMLIPAFTSLGAGIAQVVQLKSSGARQGAVADEPRTLSAHENAVLPPPPTEYISPAESRYRTGDLVPPSVTESTTRHLESERESETMTLPKI